MFLVIWALVKIAAVIADYYIPICGIKKFGETKGGEFGATIRLIIGMFFFPSIGLIAGLFIWEFA